MLASETFQFSDSPNLSGATGNFEVEPNNSRDSANKLMMNQPIQGQAYGDKDYFTFSVPRESPGKYNIKIDSIDGSSARWNTYLYNVEGGRVEEFFTPEPDFGGGSDRDALRAAARWLFEDMPAYIYNGEARTVALSGGTYFLALGGGPSTDYLLMVTPAPPSDSAEASHSASFRIEAHSLVVDEGSYALFKVTLLNTEMLWLYQDATFGPGFEVSGIQYADIDTGRLEMPLAEQPGGTLIGVVKGPINLQTRSWELKIPILNDWKTEGPETMTVAVRFSQGTDVASASVTINDTSRSQPSANNREFIAGAGDETFQGAADQLDIVRVPGSFRDFHIQKTGPTTVVTDRVGSNGRDTLVNIERIKFSDKAVALDTEAVGGQAYRVYKAAFNREPDAGGLGFWIAQMDSGMNMVEVAARFIDSNEFRTMYGTSPTDEQYLTKVYQNVLGRDPEPDGYNWWLNEIRTNPEKTRAKVLADFSESLENKTGTAQLVGQGIVYEPWVG